MGRGRKTHVEEQSQVKLIDKSYEYLLEQFHKFTENNKVKIALEIVKKHLPTKMEHSGSVDLTDWLKDNTEDSKDE